VKGVKHLDQTLSLSPFTNSPSLFAFLQQQGSSSSNKRTAAATTKGSSKSFHTTLKE